MTSSQDPALPPTRKAAASRAKDPVSLRDLLLVLAIASVALLGAVPGARGEPDPSAFLVWLALWSLPAGFLCGASGVRIWPLAPVVPAAWMALFGFVISVSRRDVPGPVWAALAWSSLYALGFALGRSIPRARWRGTAALLLASALASGLCLSGAILRTPLPAAVRARLLDLSPATFLAECAGFDWMRHPVVYDAAMTVDIDPALRSAFRGSLAAPLAFVVTCAAALVADRVARRRAARAPSAAGE